MAKRVMEFEEWVRFVFDRPENEPNWFCTEDADAPFEALGRNAPPVIVEYLTRLFCFPPPLLDHLSDRQLATGVGFVFGLGSGYLLSVEEWNVAEAASVAMIRAVPHFYEHVLAPRCGSTLCSTNDNRAPLDTVVYMIWDNDCLSVRRWDAKHTVVDLAILATLGDILKIENEVCRESALHGLGHSVRKYPAEVSKIIRSWLDTKPAVSAELLDYADAADSGYIM